MYVYVLARWQHTFDWISRVSGVWCRTCRSRCRNAKQELPKRVDGVSVSITAQLGKIHAPRLTLHNTHPTINSARYTLHGQDISYRTLYWSTYTLTLTLTDLSCPWRATLTRRDNIHTASCDRQHADRPAIDQNIFRVACLNVNTEPYLRWSGDCACWTTLHYYVIQSYTTYIHTYVCVLLLH